MSWLVRIRPGVLVVFTSVFGGAAYRHFRRASTEESLNPHTFTPYTLVDKQPVSSSSAIFTLKHRHGATDPESVKEAWKRSVWSVQVKQPQLQIGRAYTPLPAMADGSAVEEEKAGDLRLLIRKEEGGEVSTYLHGLPQQSTIELRGPNVECELPHDIKNSYSYDGHTPTNPMLHGQSTWRKRLLGLSQPAAQVTLVDNHSSQGKGVLVQELEALKERSKAGTRGLNVQYYVDEEKTFIKPDDIAKRLHVDRPDEKGPRVILVSGPDGFTEHWAGKGLWEGKYKAHSAVCWRRWI